MIYSKPEMLAMAINQSEVMGLEPALVCAVIHVLSEWMPNALNIAPGDTVFTASGMPEADDLQMTYGLLQFTGVQARQTGYTGPLRGLIEPEPNLVIGLEILKSALNCTNRTEAGLTVYLGRGRSTVIPAVLGLMPSYQELISQRPQELIR